MVQTVAPEELVSKFFRCRTCQILILDIQSPDVARDCRSPDAPLASPGEGLAIPLQRCLAAAGSAAPLRSSPLCGRKRRAPRGRTPPPRRRRQRHRRGRAPPDNAEAAVQQTPLGVAASAAKRPRADLSVACVVVVGHTAASTSVAVALGGQWVARRPGSWQIRARDDATLNCEDASARRGSRGCCSGQLSGLGTPPGRGRRVARNRQLAARHNSGRRLRC